MTTSSSDSIFLLRGGGSQGAVAYEIVCKTFPDLKVVVWDDGECVHPTLAHLHRVRSGEEFFAALQGLSGVVKAMVAVGQPLVRERLVEQLKALVLSKYPLEFPTLVHSSAVISPSARLGSGIFVGPQAVIHTNASVASFCLVNTGAVVEHDCVLEEYVTLNPHAVLGGGAIVKRHTLLGLNASVRDHISIGSGSVIGMGGAAVRSQDEGNVTLIGVPCRAVAKKKEDQLLASAAIRWCPYKGFSLERFGSYLGPSVASGHITNDGPLQAVAASKLRDLVQSSKSVLLAGNGTAALHALGAGLEIKAGRRLRWATQAFTFPSSIQGPFCSSIVLDVDEETLYPRLDLLEQIQDQIDGVVVTNVFGLQGSMLQVEKWCNNHGKLLIFDNAATAIGFTEDGRCIHDIGTGSIVSLHETKPLGRGEGGAIFMRKEDVRYVHQAMNFGFDTSQVVRIPHRFASNWRMSDVAAAALCDHWDRVKEENWIQRQETLLRYVQGVLAEHGFTISPKIVFPTLVSCLFVRLQVTISDEHLDKMVTRLALCTPKVEAKRYYRPLSAESAGAWKAFRSTICLPFHVQLTKEMLLDEVQKLRQVVDEVVGNLKGRNATSLG